MPGVSAEYGSGLDNTRNQRYRLDHA